MFTNESDLSTANGKTRVAERKLDSSFLPEDSRECARVLSLPTSSSWALFSNLRRGAAGCTMRASVFNYIIAIWKVSFLSFFSVVFFWKEKKIYFLAQQKKSSCDFSSTNYLTVIKKKRSLFLFFFFFTEKKT